MSAHSLSPEKIAEIRRRTKAGCSTRKIAEDMKLSRSTVGKYRTELNERNAKIREAKRTYSEEQLARRRDNAREWQRRNSKCARSNGS